MKESTHGPDPNNIYPNELCYYLSFYGDTEGVGEFDLIIRQKKDKFEMTTIDGGYAF